MTEAGKAVQKQFHRAQIGRSQRFIRVHMNRALTLGQIAREAGRFALPLCAAFLRDG